MAEELGAVAETVETATPIGAETTETVETTTQVEGAEETQESTEAVEGETTEQQSVDQSQLLAHVEELKKTNPALAKELKNLYFANKAFKEAVPGGLPAVKQALQTIEDLGGTEGIEGIKAEQAEWHEIDDKFAKGDPAVLDKFAEFNPEGFAKIIPAAIDKLAQVDKDAYNHALSGIFVSTLDNWRFADTLERLADDLSRIVDDKGQPLCTRQIQALQKLNTQYEGIRELASKAPERKTDANKDQFEQERANLAKERTQLHAEYVAGRTQEHAKQRYDTLVPAEAKNQGLNLQTLKDAESYDRYLSEIDSEIAREIAKDTNTANKIFSLISSGKRQDAEKLSNSKFDAVVGQAVKRVTQRWARLTNPKGIAGKPAAKPGTTTQQTAPGVKQLKEAPDLSLVDQTLPNWRTDYMMHSKAKLKTGQRVQW